MSNISGNYAKHAKIWDWGGYDRSEEFEFWTRLVDKYGIKVLSAMSAIGEAGAYMSQKGKVVTALDFTKEMIEEGVRRFGNLSSLTFVQADICQFDLEEKAFDFAFIGSADLHHLPTKEAVTKALNSINRHHRIGGGLGLELWYPSSTSWSSPKRIFKPLKSSNENLEVWKEGNSEYNAEDMKVKISQEVFIKIAEQVECFRHAFVLQLYPRATIIELLEKCGYSVVAEYGDYGMDIWSDKSNKWIVEAIKKENR